MDYPRMLYKFGKMIKIDGRYFDYKIVDSVFEEELATEQGWYRSTRPIEIKAEITVETLVDNEPDFLVEVVEPKKPKPRKRVK
jgi:hypothetical protein